MAKVTQQEYQNVQNAVNNMYTADSLNNYKSAYSNYMSQGMSSTDAAKKASSLLVKNGGATTSSTPTQTTTTNRTATNNQSTQTNTQPTYSNNTQTQNQISTPATSTNTANTVNQDNIRKAWDNLSYEQQQEKLNQISWLKDSITKKWWTIKTADWQTVQQATPQNANVSNDWWDYQDNSPERMMQMANNLEQMYITDPWLFANEQTFRNFFINWKGRTAEQEQFLLDYYKNRQIYNEYDWYTSAKVWSMLANWQVPESYINYLKNSNPQRYQEVMAGKEQEENRIGDNSSYADLLNQAGFEDTANTAWQKKEWLLVDENNDLIDDRLYHEPTAEEREKVDRINEIDSEVLDIENTYKHTYDDLVKKYPWATKATLMAMAQDRCSDLLRRKEDLMVERTKLAWTVDYLQSERQAQDKAGQQTIANLQKNLWMYYDYSPEWMAEYAQNQYAATNVTLDQADNWTDTQKQMALQSVLDGYYDKYWSIIQRSEQQVIWDVMAYAKEKWISLSQALEENFLKPLRSKPQFATLSSGGELTAYSPKIYKVWDNGYYFDENGNLVSIWGWTSDWWWEVAGSERSNWNQVKLWETAVDTWIKNVYGSNVKLAPTVWSMLKNAVNNLKSQWIDLQVWDSYRSYETQAKAYAEDQAKPANQRKWVAAPWKSFHELWQAIDIAQSQMNDPAVIQALLDAGFTRPVKSEPRHWSYWEWKDAFGGVANNKWNAWNGGNYDPALEPFLKADPTKFSSTQWKAIKNMWYSEKQFMQIRTGYLKNLASTPDASTKKILDTIWALITKYPWEFKLKSTMLWTDYISNELWNYIADYDFVKENLTMDNLTKLKSQWATFGSLTEWERPRIENSASKLNKNKMSESAFKNELLDIYNTYAEKAGMGTLTLDDINDMYGSWTKKTSNEWWVSSTSGWGGKSIKNLGK